MVYCGGWNVEGADISGFTTTLSAGADSCFIIVDYAYLSIGSGYNTILCMRATIVVAVDVIHCAYVWC
jgi:hypothetical protein